MQPDEIDRTSRAASSSPRSAENPGNEVLPISFLRESDSPRIEGERADHIELLAAAETDLPPILVHRRTMRVIDGMHRLRAVELRGETEIEVQFFNGTEQDAFVEAVKANIEHGLPLTKADREAAATRIISSNPQYSDRRIAAIAGLAAGTVAAIRARTAAAEQAAVRIGIDGRVRPINPEVRRQIALDAIAQNPEASLRDIAKKAGISPGTVRNIRRRLPQNEEPIKVEDLSSAMQDSPARSHQEPRTQENGKRERKISPNGPRSRTLLLELLERDPSVRSTEAGRALLRSLRARAIGPGELARLADAAPAHSRYLVAEVVRGCATEWLTFAASLEQGFSRGQMDGLRGG